MRLGHTPDFRQLGQADHRMLVALAAGLPHEGVRRKQLGKILVGRDHERLKALGLRTLDQCPDDVVGLKAVDFQHRNVKCAAEVFHMRNRGSEFLGHFIALRLVGGETDVSRRWCRGIEGHSQMRRIFLFENRQQRVDESVKRRGVDALGVADRRLDQREVGAVNERHAVEQEQALGGGFGHDGQCEIVCP